MDGISWTAPTTRATADLITASIWNTDLVNNLSYITGYAGDYKVCAKTADHGFWFLCDGTAVSRTTYSDLFTVVSTSFGVGDGVATFNLPDARGRTLAMIGTHGDVDALNDNDGVAVGNRSAKHNHTFTQPTISAPTISQPAVNITDNGHTHTVPFGNSGSTGGGITDGNATNTPVTTSSGTTGITAALANAPTASAPVATSGAAGPGGTLPVDTPAYIVAGRLFIHY